MLLVSCLRIQKFHSFLIFFVYFSILSHWPVTVVLKCVKVSFYFYLVSSWPFSSSAQQIYLLMPTQKHQNYIFNSGKYFKHHSIQAFVYQVLTQQTLDKLSLLRMVLCMDVLKKPKLVGKNYINILLHSGTTLMTRMQKYITFTITTILYWVFASCQVSTKHLLSNMIPIRIIFLFPKLRNGSS